MAVDGRRGSGRVGVEAGSTGGFEVGDGAMIGEGRHEGGDG